MGIVVVELASFELSDGTEYTIELNESGKIHIHIDDLRIGLTKTEFRQLAQCSVEGYQTLAEYKDLKKE